MSTTLIRFSHQQFAGLRQQLLQDLSRESFALIYGRKWVIGDQNIVKVMAVRYPNPDDYLDQKLSFLKLKRQFIYDALVEIQQNEEMDALIDVHTHPFCEHGVSFSNTDDQDERTFYRWINETVDGIDYGSIVLSQTDYTARIWKGENDHIRSDPAQIKTQTMPESWPDASPSDHTLDGTEAACHPQTGYMARSALALGVDTLRQMMHGQIVVVIGVGGLGSVIAENLIHSGFQNIHLIDPDQVEFTNLNRIVGAYYRDAEQQRLKVDVVKQHLDAINPAAEVKAHAQGVEESAVEEVLAQSDWIIAATDNHYSRYKAQELALQYAIPLITAGVNISVVEGHITDMSGEVIIARHGDGLCLNCLGRINPTQVAAGMHQDQPIGEELIKRGYVQGTEVKEPAVKTLNAILGAMTVDTLINQYTQRQPHHAIMVYEDNKSKVIYPDSASLTERHKDCYHCSNLHFARLLSWFRNLRLRIFLRPLNFIRCIRLA